MDQEATLTKSETISDYQETDIFAWVNNLFEFKEDLKIEVFFISKTNVVYRAKLHGELEKQLQPLFIDGIMEYILSGIDEGLAVRGFEEAEHEENVLQRTQVRRVDALVGALNWLKTQEHEIELFQEDHDLKRMRGVIARCSHSHLPHPFYVIKRLPSAQLLKGEGAWMLKENNFVPVTAGVLRIPTDNQLLVIDQDLFVFNQAKLEQLFGYNVKKSSIAEKKVKAIETNYTLHFAGDLDLQTLVKGNKMLINKLQKLEPGVIRQQELLDHAEELGIDLIMDETGAIIIMDTKDLTIFVNLLNDDYIASPLTGQKYEIKSKKVLKVNQEASET